MEFVEEAAAIKMQSLYRGLAGRRRREQQTIQDAQTLPASLKALVPHSYGTALCKHPVHFEHAEFAFGTDELVPIKMIGPPSLFELVVQILVGTPPSHDATSTSHFPLPLRLTSYR